MKLTELEGEESPDKTGEKDSPVYGVKDLFRRSQLAITLPLFFCWPVITMLYYGLSLSADKIHMTDNVYLSYILVSLIEMPAYIFLPLIVCILLSSISLNIFIFQSDRRLGKEASLLHNSVSSWYLLYW